MAKSKLRVLCIFFSLRPLRITEGTPWATLILAKNNRAGFGREVYIRFILDMGTLDSQSPSYTLLGKNMKLK
jgi:hypothetical protein